MAHAMRAREPKADELEVRLPGSCQRTDEDIAAAAVSALRSNVLVPADKIKVDVVMRSTTTAITTAWCAA